MNLKENYLNEISQLKNERIERVIEAAKIEFNEKGIKNSKLIVIAKRANVGEASIYRYFKDKDDLIKKVSVSYWQSHTNFFDDNYSVTISKKDTGLQKVEMSLNIFQYLFIKHNAFIKFAKDFDCYYSNEEVALSDNSSQETICSFKKRFIIVFNEGIQDGTINPEFNGLGMYNFISRVMTSTTQMLSTRNGSLHEEDPDYPINFLNSIIKMFIKYIKT